MGLAGQNVVDARTVMTTAVGAVVRYSTLDRPDERVHESQFVIGSD